MIHLHSASPRRHRAHLGATLAATALLALGACSDDGSSPAADADQPDASDVAATDTVGDSAPDAPADTADVPMTDTPADTTPTDTAADAAPDTPTDVADADAALPRTLDPWPSASTWPACGTPTTHPGILPGPSDDDFDADLAAKARQLERQFHAFNTFGVDLNRELSVSLEDTESRDLITEFVTTTDEWDFEAWSGSSAGDVITSYHKVAGAYGGVGAAADAMRYATLRAEGAPCEDLEIARGFIRANLDAMHLATAITGVEGVIARGFARADQPGTQYETVPLFAEDGSPLPEEKNNGTWRDDNSGLYPDYIWEDSCSRDMLIGWVIGMTATWEVIRDDPAFSDELKQRLRDDARAIAETLMTVQESGYDMEIQDADGRPTFHATLHHETIDRAYVPGINNGFNAMMGIGIMAGFAFITEDADIEAFIYEDLVDQRDYLDLIVRQMNFLDLGFGSNFSMYNMVFQGGWLAQRYLRDPVARAAARQSVQTAIYDRGGERQPREQKQTFFDFTYAASLTGESAFTAPDTALPDDALTAIANGLETLGEWNDIPYWNFGHDNCDETELESRDCLGDDGTPIQVLGTIGRNGDLIAADPVPMRIRPASNYWWRSNPYKPNGGGDGRDLYPGSDFRFAYWMGRYFRAAP